MSPILVSNQRLLERDTVRDEADARDIDMEDIGGHAATDEHEGGDEIDDIVSNMDALTLLKKVKRIKDGGAAKRLRFITKVRATCDPEVVKVINATYEVCLNLHSILYICSV